MSHIVIVGKYYPPYLGGVERHTADLATLAAQRHEVTVVVHNTGRKDSVEQQGNIQVVRCGTSITVSSQPLSLSTFKHLRRALRRADLVIFNAPNFWSGLVLLLSRYDAPLVVVHHADVFGRPLLRRLVMPSYHALIRRTRCIVVNSHRNAAGSKDIPNDVGPFMTIPHGLDPAPFQLSEADRAAVLTERRRRFGHAPVVGFVGRLVRYKGLSVLINAISRLERAHCVIIGDGPMRQAAEEQVAELGMADRVHFEGQLSETAKARTMAMFDVFAFPSIDSTEAFGLSQIEAQFCRLPIVASALATGVVDVTLDGQTGILVPPGDPAALAAAIRSLLDNPALARAYGEAGFNHAMRNLTVEAFHGRFHRLIEAILSKAPLTELPGFRASKV